VLYKSCIIVIIIIIIIIIIIQKRRLMLFGHLIRMDESAVARRILTAVPQSDWRRPVGRPYSSWVATLKNDLPLCTTLPMRMLSKWPWISRCGDYWPQAELRTDGACRIMMMMMWNSNHLTAIYMVFTHPGRLLNFLFFNAVFRFDAWKFLQFSLRCAGK